MTAARKAVEEIMDSEHADVLRESVAWMVAKSLAIPSSSRNAVVSDAIGPNND